MRDRLRLFWWQVRTAVLLALPSHADRWRKKFHTDPALTFARRCVDRSEEGHADLGLQTMAGYYNDHVHGGFMSTVQARHLYLGE